MNRNEIIETLELMAMGYSPTTGEILSDDNILHEQKISIALNFAIKNIKGENEVEIYQNEVKLAIEILEKQLITPTYTRLLDLFLALKKFKKGNIDKHHLYGRFKNKLSKGELLVQLERSALTKNFKSNRPWKEIKFFRRNKFNELSINGIKQLKQKVGEIKFINISNISEQVKNARQSFPRAFEPWSEKEKTLLRKALRYTNDLSFLSNCFQRGQGGIESLGKKIIFENSI